MTNQNVEKKREFFAFDIAYKSRTNKENNPISTALIWDEIQQRVTKYMLEYVNCTLPHVMEWINFLIKGKTSGLISF